MMLHSSMYLLRQDLCQSSGAWLELLVHTTGPEEVVRRPALTASITLRWSDLTRHLSLLVIAVRTGWHGARCSLLRRLLDGTWRISSERSTIRAVALHVLVARTTRRAHRASVMERC